MNTMELDLLLSDMKFNTTNTDSILEAELNDDELKHMKQFVDKFKDDQDKGVSEFKKKLMKLFRTDPELFTTGKVNPFPLITHFVLTITAVAVSGLSPAAAFVPLAPMVANVIISRKLNKNQSIKLLKEVRSEISKVEKEVSKASGTKRKQLESYLSGLKKTEAVITDYNRTNNFKENGEVIDIENNDIYLEAVNELNDYLLELI